MLVFVHFVSPQIAVYVVHTCQYIPVITDSYAANRLITLPSVSKKWCRIARDVLRRRAKRITCGSLYHEDYAEELRKVCKVSSLCVQVAWIFRHPNCEDILTSLDPMRAFN